MTNNDVKVVIASRFFCKSIVRDCEALMNDRREVYYHAELAATTIAPSLANQTDKNFEHHTIINDKADPQLMKDYQKIVADSGLDTKIISYSDWGKVIKGIYAESHALCLSRMDIDDLINSNAVLLAKQAYVPGRLTIHGYDSGIRFDATTGGYELFEANYHKLGHHSIMQSCIYDHPLPFYNIYCYRHNLIKEDLQKVNDKFADEDLIVIGDERCEKHMTYVYVRQPEAQFGFSKLPQINEKAWPDCIDYDKFKVCFGISPDKICDNCSKIMRNR